MVNAVLRKTKDTKLYFMARNMYYRMIDWKFNFEKFIRIYFSNSNYMALKMLKNMYMGNRCFIIATGPSLEVSDLDMLKNEYCFACNSIITAYDLTDWRPSFYGIQDPGVYKKLKNKINFTQYKYVFLGNLIKDSNSSSNGNVIKYPLNLLGHTVALFNNKLNNIEYKFSNTCDIEIMDGFSVTYSLFQIAVYLGFKEIFFLGQDCNYDANPERQHFMGNSIEQKFNPHWQQSGKLICNAFEASKDFCSKNSIRVFNATRGGMFDVFPRVKLEDIVKR